MCFPVGKCPFSSRYHVVLWPEASPALSVPNRGHCETGDEGTQHLQLLQDRHGMEWNGLAVPALTQQGHCVTLWYSEGLAQPDHERSSQGMRRNGFADETWRR